MEMMMKQMASRRNLRDAFAAIRKAGGFAWQGLECCSGCAWGEAQERIERAGKDVNSATVALFSRQGADAFADFPGGVQGQFFRRPLAIQWLGDREFLAKAFREAGLGVIVPDDETAVFWVGESDEWLKERLAARA